MRTLIGLFVAIALGWAADRAFAHAGSADPVPAGCMPVVESVTIKGVRIDLRRVICPDEGDRAPTS